MAKAKRISKPRKRVSRRKSSKDQNYLMAAMSDIGKELRRLTSGKKNLRSRLDGTRRELLNLKAREDRARDRLTKLIAKEGPIHENQRNLKRSITELKNRILKVKKIREEIRDPE